MDRHRAVPPVGRSDQPQRAACLMDRNRLLFVAGIEPQPRGHDPDLQQVHPLRWGRVEFAVRDAAPCAHALHLARPDHRTGSQAVAVFQRAFQDVRDDLHVPVRMHRESFAALDPVFVQHPQVAERHVLRVVIAVKRKRVAALQPPELRSLSFRTRPQPDHGIVLLSIPFLVPYSSRFAPETMFFPRRAPDPQPRKPFC